MKCDKYILVLNAGSSSIKFSLHEFKNFNVIAQGICERIGVDGNFKIEHSKKESQVVDFKDHKITFDFLLKKLKELNIIENFSDICIVGHRVVQGGGLKESKLIDDEVLEIIHDSIKLAPLHNKPEYDLIKIVQKEMPYAKNVAVFDTSFHSTIPKLNNHYAVPGEWIKKYNIKKYGFHGTSYKFILEKFNEISKKKKSNIIVCHLGNGASVCCIKNNKSYDTTMGLTPNAGLIMGTRCGDIDATIIGYLASQENISIDEIIKNLNNNSGLKSLCNNSDYRDIIKNISPGNDFDFANNIFAQKVTDYIVKYINYLDNKVDAIIFTGGIGENNSLTRSQIIKNIKIKSISINKNKNTCSFEEWKKISTPKSDIDVYVIKTNEELMIAKDSKKIANI